MSKGNDERVILDINFPEFLDEYLALDVPELKKVNNTFRKLRAMTWNQVFKDHGLNWEEIKSVPDHFSIRLSKSYRCVVIRQGAYMRFISLHLDHDGAYGKK